MSFMLIRSRYCTLGMGMSVSIRLSDVHFVMDVLDLDSELFSVFSVHV